MSARIEEVGELLTGRGLGLVTAESCTGGLLAARLTARAGASRFFEAGLVTYSNAAKEAVLGVRRDTLVAHGAVSEAVALEMARGARRHGDVGVAITGIAGPDGGTADKPVGTVWIAISIGETEAAHRFLFPGDRTSVREATVEHALKLVLDHCDGDGGAPS